MTTAKIVRAAGGVVWRRGDDGVLEVVLVHRPAYDDWTLPKGKWEDEDGSDEATATREVFEETGLTCRLGSELETVEYVDGRGRRKRVRYWAMTVESSTPRSPDHEVDATRWLPVDDAETVLTYDRDRSVLRTSREVLDTP